MEIKPDKIIIINDNTNFDFLKSKFNRMSKKNSGEYIFLYRPVYSKEHYLIRSLRNKSFPTVHISTERMFPTFYATGSEERAITIAKEYSKNLIQGGLGAVVRFNIKKDFVQPYTTRLIGRDNWEYSIPTFHMNRINGNIIGDIDTLHVYYKNAD